ncbi:MAG TPA: protein kinase [Thermoanaerobaculia bacterium]|nr:protein kinase [Thermoanaerobaculia bacterium]
MSALPLQRIEGKYEILEKIREGGMGAIYKVRHRLLDEVRVIKLMRPQLVDDQELKARFAREARVAIKLRHPNIAQLYDFTADDDGTALIVMEFIRGKTLEELLKTAGSPPLGLALEIAQQSLRALGYLHDKGFVHRDISPDNLMLTEDADGNPQMKLIDLGIAKILGGVDAHLTQTGTFLGKVRYASPEQFGTDGATSAGASGDLYSFGVVLYELLTGVHPIAGRDPSSIIAGHLFRGPVAFEETDRHGRVPLALRAVVLKALAKKPEGRHPSAREFARELAALRVAGDLSPEWKKLLETAGDGDASPAEPGSTQDRLDAHFGAEATPAPSGPSGATHTLLAPLTTVSPLVPVETTRDQERQRAIAAAAQGVEAALVRGDLRAAEAKLYGAEAEFGEQSLFQELHGRLAAQRRAELGAQVGRLVERARSRAAAGDLEAAHAELKRALQLDPERADLAAEAAETAAALARQAAEKQRQEAMAKAVQEVDAQLAAGNTDRAGKLLDRARAEHGEDAAFEALARRLEEMRSAALAAELAALLDEARRLAGQEQLKEAGKVLRRAERLAPEDAAVRQLQAEVAATSQRLEAERRRLAQIERRAAEIGKRLDRGALDEGAALLDGAVAELGEAAPWEGLRARLERLRDEARQAQVASFVERARELASGGEPAEALGSARRAAEIDPSRRDVQELVAELEAALERQARERRLAEELAKTIAALSDHLDRGELDQAGNLLDHAVSRFGATPVLREHWERLEKLRRQALAEKIRDLLGRVRQSIDAGDPAAARETLGEAGALGVADTPEVRQAAAEVEAAAEREAQDRRRREDLLAAVGAIEAHLQRGEHAKAAKLLAAAAAAHGEEAEPLQRLRGRLQAQERAEDLLGEAHLRLEIADVEAAMRKLREALELAPGYAPVQALLDRVQAVRKQPAAREMMRTLRQSVGQGRGTGSGTLHLRPAPAAPAPEAAAVQEAAAVPVPEAAAVQEAAAVHAPEAAPVPVPDGPVGPLPAPPSNLPEAAVHPKLAGAPVESTVEAASPLPGAVAAAGAVAGVPDRTVVLPAGHAPSMDSVLIAGRRSMDAPLDFRLRADATAALPPTAVAAPFTRDLPAEVPERSAGVPRRSKVLAAGIILAVAVLAAAGWLIGHRGSREQAAGPAQAMVPAPVPAPPPAVMPGQPRPGAVPPQSGVLIVDALPWGEVVEIRDARGKTQLVPAHAYTPLVLSLPPGRFTVRLTNPAFSQAAVLEAEVPADGGAHPVRRVAEFKAGDADEFLKGMGW